MTESLTRYRLSNDSNLSLVTRSFVGKPHHGISNPVHFYAFFLFRIAQHMTSSPVTLFWVVDQNNSWSYFNSRAAASEWGCFPRLPHTEEIRNWAKLWLPLYYSAPQVLYFAKILLKKAVGIKSRWAEDGYVQGLFWQFSTGWVWNFTNSFWSSIYQRHQRTLWSACHLK